MFGVGAASPTGNEVGAVPIKGTSVGAGIEPSISTGNKTLDLLLEARIAPDSAASASMRRPAAAAASSPTADAADEGGRALSLRDALLRDAATQARLISRNEELHRFDQQGVTRGPVPTGNSGSDAVGRETRGNGEEGRPVIAKSVFLALREYRYWIVGVALVLLVMAWAVSAMSPKARVEPSVGARAERSKRRRRTRRRA